MGSPSGTAAPSVLDRVLRDWRAVASSLPAAESRGHAAARLGELGWPSHRDEQWRYANLRAFDRIGRFSPELAAPDPATAPLLPPVPPGFTRLVYLDGRPIEGGHAMLARDDTTTPEPAAASWSGEQRLGLLADMFGIDPIRLHVQGEAAVELVLLARAGFASYPRIDIRIAPGSHLRLIERHLGSGQGTTPALVAAATTISIGREASLTHYRLQHSDPHCVLSDTLSAHLDAQARYSVRSVAVGGGSARTSGSVALSGRGAALSWAAVAVGRADQTHDTSVSVRHEAAETSTQEIFRGIGDDRSRVAFSGHIRIDPAAAGARTSQSLRGLIEGQAEIDLRPRLEILTDDVRAAHGATTGRLDEDLLFYLLARGIDRPTARALLKWAFLGDALREFDDPAMRAEAERMAAGNLPDVPPLTPGER